MVSVTSDVSTFSEYAESHDIKGLLEWISMSLFQNRPVDPINFLIDALTKKKKESSKSAAGSGLHGARKLSRKAHCTSSIRGLLDHATEINPIQTEQEQHLILPKMGDENQVLFNMELISAAKASLGPMVLRVETLKERVESKERQQKILEEKNPQPGDEYILRYSSGKSALEDARKDVEKAENKITQMHECLNLMRMSIAKLLSGGIGEDICAYEEVMNNTDQECRALVSEKCSELEKLGNYGALSIGEEVFIKKKTDMSNRKARIREISKDEMYVVDLWVEDWTVGMEYQEGYEIKHKWGSVTKNEREILHRREIYSKDKQKQKLSIQSEIKAENPQYLIMLYHDASRAWKSLQKVGQQLTNTLGERIHFKLPGLKAKKRVFAKVYEKYDGDFSRITDLCRCTVACDTMQTILDVLCFLDATPELGVLRIKNRISRFYNADEFGGYRDILINCRETSTGHIIEVQVTLWKLLEIKEGTSHQAYTLARLVDLNAKDTTEFKGTLNDSVISKIKIGLIRKLSLGEDSDIENYFDKLVGALKAPTCLVSKISIWGGWCHGKQVSDLFTDEVIKQRAPHMRHVSVTPDKEKYGQVGDIPEAFFKYFTKLTYFGCESSFVGGTIPREIGAWKNLTNLSVFDCNFRGTIPRELGNCKKLEKLYLNDCQYEGHFPVEALKSLKHIERITAWGNNFSNTQGYVF